MVDGPGDLLPSVAAANERTLLRDHLHYLQNLERQIRQAPGNDTREEVRADAVAIAVEHLLAALDALAMAAQE
jgi:hypothetical protein